MITITWVSRNDDHGGNLIPRIQASLDSLVEYRDMFGLDVEVAFVEWNPPTDTLSLRQVLSFPDNFPLRWYIVPPELHQKFQNWERFTLWNHIGTNVGMRRAKGNWVLATTHDIIFSKQMAQILAKEEFSSSCFYRAVRVDGHTNLKQDLSTEERIRQMVQNVIRIKSPSNGGLFFRACGDFILMSREKWHSIRGYTEWPVLGMYFDGLLLCRAYAGGMKQGILHPQIYHMEHSGRGQDLLKDLPHMSHDSYKRLRNKILQTKKTIKVNTPNWGLGDCTDVQIDTNAWKIVSDSNPFPTLPIFGKWRNA